jgi:hypothetical protein
MNEFGIVAGMNILKENELLRENPPQVKFCST